MFSYLFFFLTRPHPPRSPRTYPLFPFTPLFRSPIPGTDTTSTVKHTYVARESVTVPAGTFETCHFQEDVTVSGATATTDMWVTVGSGIQIKEIGRAHV